jgi:hypothetical protein
VFHFSATPNFSTTASHAGISLVSLSPSVNRPMKLQMPGFDHAAKNSLVRQAVVLPQFSAPSRSMKRVRSFMNRAIGP